MTLDDLRTFGILFVIWFVWLIRRSIKKERAAWAEATKYDPKNTRGDAGFATDDEIKAAGAFKKSEISIGFTLATNREIFYNPKDDQLKPTLVFGSMGSGKTTCTQIPLALRWKGSLIIFEATGETAITTAHYRRKFGPVSIINPMGAYRRYLKGLPEVSYNPLDPYWCNPNDPNTFGTRMAKIAAGCAEESDSRNKFWDNSSRGMIKTIAMAEVALRPGRANLGRIADIIYQDPAGYTRYAVSRVTNPKLYARLMRYARPSADDIRSIQEVRENTSTQLEFLMEEPIANCLKGPGIKIGSLRQRAQTLIIILPLSDLGVLDRFRTLMLECTLSELQSDQWNGPIPVGILCDELAQYGYMASVKLAMSSLRKFNCFMSVCVNDYGTLCDIYKEGSSTFESNAGVVQWMATKDLEGSQHLNEILGAREVYAESKSITHAIGGNKASVNTTFSAQSRDLLFGYEIRQLPAGQQIVRLDGVSKYILCNKVPYFKTKLRRLARPNPYHRPKKQWWKLF